MVWYQPIFAYLLYRFVYKLKKELSENIYDLFLIIQYITIILFLILREVFFGLQIINGFESFYDSASFFVLIMFYFFEFVNNICWTDFIFHMKSYQSKPKTKYSSKRIKKIEICLLILTIGFAIFLLFSSATIVGVQIGANCWTCKEQIKESCEDITCINIKAWVNAQYIFLAVVGFIEMIWKVIIGIFIFYYLKTQLNFYFNKRKNSLVIVIIGSCIIIMIKFFFTLFQPWAGRELTNLYNQRTRISFSNFGIEITIAIIISLVNLSVEMILMTMNVESIYFKNDIKVIKKGSNISAELYGLSIFLIRK